MPRFRSLMRQLLHLQESPERTAMAFAIGVAIAFCPLYGLHMALVVFCTWAFGLNFVALMAGALVNNPWTIVPVLGATYWTGALILGRTEVPTFDWHDLSFMAVYQQVLPYAIPFLLGGTILSLAGALLAYPMAYRLISKYRRSSHPTEHRSIQQAAAQSPLGTSHPEPLPPRDPLG
ncbi:conserved membrane protein of unknown function [Nitrospira japonica]|uniref:DUF2062 domain-containing protein n=1 Tax=Nitrospira japonica TaxID=1325564 RepID=A0A1W1HZL0_9BACT|nr:DUF2062 domain-containing protein [Nitrospira japonica]SLM46198.1 conserved membrane protein of unknown function [Nitrospira japonica]